MFHCRGFPMVLMLAALCMALPILGGCAGMTPEQMASIGSAVTDAANGAVDAYIRLEEATADAEPTPEEVLLAQQMQLERLRAYVELLRSLGLTASADMYEHNLKVLGGEARPTQADTSAEAQSTDTTANVSQEPAPVQRE